MPSPYSASLSKKTKPRYQPREKLVRLGPKNLTDPELIALLLGKGDASHPLPQLAQTVWQSVKTRRQVQFKHHWLMGVSGLGLAKACSIYAAIELGNRLATHTKPTQVNKPEIAFQLASSIRRRIKEYALALYLDGQQQLLDSQVLAIGGSNFAFLEPAELFRPALTLPAAGVILVHNHPSGLVEPSTDDLTLTIRLQKAGSLLGIELIDHIVVTAEAFYSLREHGLLSAETSQLLP